MLPIPSHPIPSNPIPSHPHPRQYPHEEEICFAPLTGIEVQGIRVQGAVLVVEARLSVNLVALTIEQVVSKRRKVVQDMCVNMEQVRIPSHTVVRPTRDRRASAASPPRGRGLGQELASEVVSSPAWASLKSLMAASGVDDITAAARRALRAKLSLITSRPPEYFNSDEQLSGAVKAAVDNKAAISGWPVQLPSRVSGGKIDGPVSAQVRACHPAVLPRCRAAVLPCCPAAQLPSCPAALLRRGKVDAPPRVGAAISRGDQAYNGM